MRLEIFVKADGSVTLVIPQGSAVPGDFHLEASEDVRSWTDLGPLAPGNAAAFYFNVPSREARVQMFYRAVQLGTR